MQKNSMRILIAAALIVALLAGGDVATISASNFKTPKEIGSWLMESSGGDNESFVSLTEAWTMDNIKYRINIIDKSAVKSAQRAINEGYGDCSERAQVMHAILDSQGITNTVIWGDITGTKIKHAAVEVDYNGKIRVLGDMEGFQKKGAGLYSNERLVD